MSKVKSALQRLGVLAAAPSRTVGSTITARIVAEIPGPIHGIGFELRNSPALKSGNVTAWGDLFTGSDNVFNNQLVNVLYIERAIGPADTPPQAGTYTVCEVEFTCIAAGSAEISIANLLATRYAGDAVEQLATESYPAQLEVVMQETGSKVIVRVEIV